MYTGIVRGVAKVIGIHREPAWLRYIVELPGSLMDGLEIGASVSLDGVCQTVVEIQGVQITFEAIRETLERTTLGTLQLGDAVNVERSARIGDEIGGHLLCGHIYGTVEVKSVQDNVWSFQCNPIWTKYLFAKGFVALNGCSLTVAQVNSSGSFTVHLIPETLRQTTFPKKRVGDKVNLEIDSLTQIAVETVERIAERRG